jgi:hypothetical protein
MTKTLHRDPVRPVMDSLGWHVHYKVGSRVRVRLACSRETAIEIACDLLRENRDVLRLVMHDGSERIDRGQIRELCRLREIE